MDFAVQDLPATVAGWKHFYSDLSQFDTLPPVMEEAKISVEIYKRDLILDLSAIDVRDSRVRLYAFGDVVTLSSDKTFDLSSKQGSLYIIARAFSTDSTSQLQFKVGDYEAKIVVHIASLQQPLEMVFINDGGLNEHISLKPDGKERSVAIQYKDGIVQLEDIDRLPDALFRTTVPQNFIKSQLRVASLARFTHPTLSYAILCFVYHLTSMTRVASTPHLEALAMLKQLNSDRQYKANLDVCFVPTVSMSVLENTLGKLLDAASSYYDEYRLFVTTQDPHDRDRATRLLAERINDSVVSHRQLLLQAKSRWKYAQEALITASRNAEEIKQVVENLSESFAASLEEWAKEEQRRIVIKAVLSVFCLAISLAALLVGNPSGTAHSPEYIRALSDLSGSITRIEDTATQLSDVKDRERELRIIRATVGDLNESMADAQRNVETISSLNRGNPPELKHGQRNYPLPVCDPEATNAVAALEALIIGVRISMNAAIDKQVDKAQEYLVALEQQATFGKAQCRAAAMAAKAGQEYAQAFLQLHILEKQCEDSRRRMDDLQAEKASYEDRLVVFFDRFLQMKVVIVTELANYKNSFKFCTLCDSAVVLDAKRTVPQLRQDFANIQLERELYLARHSSGPQPFVLPMTLADLLTNSTEVISRLKFGDHRFTIALDKHQRSPFNDFFMVRLKGVRVWLVGAKSRNTKAVVKLRLQTNGLYKDFDENSRPFTFSTEPLDRKFYYELVGLSQGIILYDSVFTEDEYISPTPFTEWTISLLNPQDVDLSDLTSIKIQWEGHAHSLMDSSSM